MPNQRAKVERMPCDGGCGRVIELWKGRKGTRCKRCALAMLSRDPDVVARRGATFSQRLKSDPRRQATHCRAAQQAAVTKRNNPDYVAKNRAHCLRLVAEGKSRCAPPAGSPARIALTQKGLAKKMAGIPVEYWDTYRDIMRGGQFKPAEARALVADLIAADERRNAEAPPVTVPRRSFDEQVQAVRNGAPVVPVFVPRKVSAEVTLGGVASGML